MAVTIQLNSVALIPQPSETSWETESTGGKLDGTDSTGAYQVHVLKAPVHRGAVSNWATYDNQVLTSIQTHAPGDTMRGTAVVYSSGVVSKPIKQFNSPPGGLVRDVELRIMVIV